MASSLQYVLMLEQMLNDECFISSWRKLRLLQCSRYDDGIAGNSVDDSSYRRKAVGWYPVQHHNRCMWTIQHCPARTWMSASCSPRPRDTLCAFHICLICRLLSHSILALVSSKGLEMAEERSHALRTFESEMLQVSPDIDGGTSRASL